MMNTTVSRAPDQASVCDFFYELDSQDKILEIGGRRAGAGGDISICRRVVGTSLFDHVSGHFTRRFLRDFLTNARTTGERWRRLYRCDSPLEKRVMEMRAEPLPDGRLRLEHYEIEAAPLPFPVKILTAFPSRRATAKRCSMCNRLQARGGGPWREPEDHAQPGVSPVVIHTVCGDCRNSIGSRLKRV